MTPQWLDARRRLVVNQDVATVIGLNEAIVLQQVRYWLTKSKHIYDGRKWTYHTFEEWHDEFPFWSIRTIKRIFHNLEKEGLLITGNFNKQKFDKTKWYSIDIELLDHRMCQVGTKQSDKVAPSDSANMAQPIPETTQETTSKTTTNNQAQPDTLAQQRREVIEYLNKKTDSKFKPNAKGNKSVIDPRLKEGYTVDDMKMIIDTMYSKWHGNKFSNGSMGDDYLRPETLFRVSKIEGYLNIARKMKKQQKPDDMFDMDGWIRE